jgi:hypothetical protein
MGATGKSTFGSDNSPLCEVIKNYGGPISILLVAPESPGFMARTRDLAISKESYAKEIFDCIDHCKSLLKESRKEISVRLYLDEPIWKMVVTNRVLWIQHYRAGEHVDDTPLYGFQFRGEKSNIQNGFIKVFQRRWNAPETISLNLQKWNRSKYVFPSKKP